jgi:hypothetical protein
MACKNANLAITTTVESAYLGVSKIYKVGFRMVCSILANCHVTAVDAVLSPPRIELLQDLTGRAFGSKEMSGVVWDAHDKDFLLTTSECVDGEKEKCWKRCDGVGKKGEAAGDKTKLG